MPEKRKKCKNRGGGGGGVRSGVGGGRWLVARLVVVGDVQYWECKPRIEGIFKCT